MSERSSRTSNSLRLSAHGRRLLQTLPGVTAALDQETQADLDDLEIVHQLELWGRWASNSNNSPEASLLCRAALAKFFAEAAARHQETFRSDQSRP